MQIKFQTKEECNKAQLEALDILPMLIFGLMPV